MKRMILMLTAFLPLLVIAQPAVIMESLRLIESSSADMQYANEFGYMRNPDLDEPFPYVVIRMEVEGDVQQAKVMLSLDLGTNFKVEAKNVHKDNMILFVVKSSARSIYLQCGDGCKEQELYYGALMANKVYACKVAYKAGEQGGGSNADVAAMQKQMEEMRMQMEDIRKQNQQNGENGKANVDGAKKSLEQVVQTPRNSNNEILPIEVNGVTFNMVKVEGGTFLMGSEEGSEDEWPVHKVKLGDFYIGETEVTQALWIAVMEYNPSEFKGDNLPVERVSWDDCQEFIRKLNKLTGRKFALPTEQQWEYAAQGGKMSRGYEFSGSNNLDDVGWNWNNSGDSITTGDYKYSDEERIKGLGCRTHPVGQKQANELGIYDMSGNVDEWCREYYKPYDGDYESYPPFRLCASFRINRGGDWKNNASDCRSADRSCGSPDAHYNSHGLRLVLLK